MADQIDSGAIKIVEVMGVSQESFEDSIQKAVAKASSSIKGITGLEVVKQTARVKDGQIRQFNTTIKLAFAVE